MGGTISGRKVPDMMLANHKFSDRRATQLVAKLEDVLLQLDAIDAKVAALHVDSAIAEICRRAKMERSGGLVQNL